VDETGVQASSVNQASTHDGEFELVEGEDANLPWKCAACEFMDPAKQVVVDHWQRQHCLQVSFVAEWLDSGVVGHSTRDATVVGSNPGRAARCGGQQPWAGCSPQLA